MYYISNKRGLCFLVQIIIITSFFIPKSIKAQLYPPGFDFRIEWEHYEEQSKDRREINITDIGGRVGYSFPQTLDVFVTIGWQDIENILPDPVSGRALEFKLDSALAFKLGARIYVFKNIPIGMPADFCLSVSYNTARHKEKDTRLKFKHRRIIGLGTLEWRYARSIPYLGLGVLYSDLKTPFDVSLDQTSLFFNAGASFQIVENVYLNTEINWCQEVGYTFGIQYRF